MKLEEIRISKAFQKHTPSERKMERFRRFYEENGCIDKPLVLNRTNILLDGYARYLVLKECGVEETEQITYNENFAKYRTEETTYVYAKHHGIEREFVWRVPKHRIDLSDLKVGDDIVVRTKYGTKKVTISRIEQAKIPPTTQPIKRVVKKCKED